MRLTRLCALGLIAGMGVTGIAAQAASPWQQPAAALAGQIANLLGPGQAQMTVRNLSSIAAGELAAIRSLLEQDLQARGVTVAGADSPNTIRVTLSENAEERLWVAEVIEGDETQVAMVDAGPVSAAETQAAGGMALRRQTILTTHAPVLAALATAEGLVVLEPEAIAIYAQAADGWREQQRVRIGQIRPLVRDPRGTLLAAPEGQGFEAWLAGAACTGSFSSADGAGGWTVSCHESDDPWVISQAVTPPAEAPQLPALQAAAPAASSAAQPPPLKAFYNGARDYFTGVITPSPEVDLPAFYTAVLLPRAEGGAALLIGGIDGKVQLLENGALAPVDGARDWGSDFATLHSGCGAGAQVLASGSGEAISDSLRAYDLPAREAVPASAPLAMGGTVMAVWTAPDGKSVLAAVRAAPGQYEVDRVTASCN